MPALCALFSPYTLLLCFLHIQKGFLSRGPTFLSRAISRFSSVGRSTIEQDNSPMVSLVVDQDDRSGENTTSAIGTGITEYHYVFTTASAKARRIVDQVAWEWHVARYDPKLDIEMRDKHGPQQLRFLFAVRLHLHGRVFDNGGCVGRSRH
jgi:hypothetical protein